eukprot:9314669-Pyramimonas_sp.AAC.1
MARLRPTLRSSPNSRTPASSGLGSSRPPEGSARSPPGIAHRFNKESRFQMCDFLKEVEGAFLQLGKMAPAVVEGPTSEKLRRKWIAEVEVNVMAKIRRAALSTAAPLL